MTMALVFCTSVLAITKPQNSTNWAGLIAEPPSNSETFNSVSGRFTVPLPRAPKGATSGAYKASVWVGIDGVAPKTTSILQAGFDMELELQSDGKLVHQNLTYNAWYEWFPAIAVNLPQSEFSMMAGDEIRVDISISSFSKGVVVLTNLHTSQVFSKTLNSPGKESDLKAVSVEWIMEDFTVGGKLVDLVNFGTINITNCRASTDKTEVNLKNANIFTLITSFSDSPKLLSDTKVLSDTAAQITYTGE